MGMEMVEKIIGENGGIIEWERNNERKNLSIIMKEWKGKGEKEIR